MANLNAFPETDAQYNTGGTVYPDNLRVGGFNVQGQNTVGLGVQVGNVQVYSIKPVFDYELFENALTVNNTSYMPLSTATGVIPGERVELDVPRRLWIYGTVQFAVIVSGYDEYGQKLTSSGVATPAILDEYLFTTGAAYKSITSVYIYGIGAPSADFKIRVSYEFGLPYTDNGDPTRIISAAYKDVPLLKVAAGALPKVLAWDFVYQPANADGVNPNATTRPILEAYADGWFDGTGVLTVQQSVDFYGFTLEQNAPFSQNNPNHYPVQDITKVIGVVPYSVGWTGWKG